MERVQIPRAESDRQQTTESMRGKKKRLEKSYGSVHKRNYVPFVNKPTANEHRLFTSSQRSANLRTTLLGKKNINPLTLRKNATF